MGKVGEAAIIVTAADPKNNYEITCVNGTLTILALPTYAVEIAVYDEGTIESNVKSASAGTKVTLTVTPKDGYTLEKLTVADESGKTVDITKTADGKYTFTMPDSKVTITAVWSKLVTGMPFVDVTKEMWSYDDISYAYAKGLMVGTSATTFAPHTTTERAVIVTVLYRLEGEPEVSGACPFTDVAPGKYYTAPFTWAASVGIIEGYGNGKCGPRNPITREQLAAVLYRYSEFKGYDVIPGSDAEFLGYNDHNTVSNYAIPAMQWACSNGLIYGYNNNLMPRKSATREQFAAILHRFCEKVAN